MGSSPGDMKERASSREQKKSNSNLDSSKSGIIREKQRYRQNTVAEQLANRKLSSATADQNSRLSHLRGKSAKREKGELLSQCSTTALGVGGSPRRRKELGRKSG